MRIKSNQTYKTYLLSHKYTDGKLIDDADICNIKMDIYKK
jgi:hypothetical protein